MEEEIKILPLSNSPIQANKEKHCLTPVSKSVSSEKELKESGNIINSAITNRSTPVFGKDKAKKLLKALGSQKQYHKEKQSNRTNQHSSHSTNRPKHNKTNSSHHENNGLDSRTVKSATNSKSRNVQESEINANNACVTKPADSLEALKAAYFDADEQDEKCLNDGNDGFDSKTARERKSNQSRDHDQIRIEKGKSLNSFEKQRDIRSRQRNFKESNDSRNAQYRHKRKYFDSSEHSIHERPKTFITMTKNSERNLKRLGNRKTPFDSRYKSFHPQSAFFRQLKKSNDNMKVHNNFNERFNANFNDIEKQGIKSKIRYTQCLPVISFAERYESPERVAHSLEKQQTNLQKSETLNSTKLSFDKSEMEEGEIDTCSDFGSTTSPSIAIQSARIESENKSSIELKDSQKKIQITQLNSSREEVLMKKVKSHLKTETFKKGQQIPKITDRNINLYENNDDTTEEGELICDRAASSEADTDEYSANWENDDFGDVKKSENNCEVAKIDIFKEKHSPSFANIKTPIKTVVENADEQHNNTLPRDYEPSLTPPLHFPTDLKIIKNDEQVELAHNKSSAKDIKNHVNNDSKVSSNKGLSEKKIEILYDEYEQFLLTVDTCDEKPSNKGVNINIEQLVLPAKTADDEEEHKSPKEKLTNCLKEEESDHKLMEDNSSQEDEHSSTEYDSSSSTGSSSSSSDNSSSESSSSSSSSSDSSESSSSSSSSSNSNGQRTRWKKLHKAKMANRHHNDAVNSCSEDKIGSAHSETMPVSDENDKLDQSVTIKDYSIKTTLESLGLAWDANLLSDDDLLLKVENFKIHCKEKQKEKEQAGKRKNDDTEASKEETNEEPTENAIRETDSHVLDNSARSAIRLKIKPISGKSSHAKTPDDMQIDFTERLKPADRTTDAKVPSNESSSNEKCNSSERRRSGSHTRSVSLRRSTKKSRSERSKDRRSPDGRGKTSKKHGRSRSPYSSKHSSSSDRQRKKILRDRSNSPSNKSRKRRISVSPHSNNYKRANYSTRNNRKSSLTPPRSSRRYHSRHQGSISPVNHRRRRSISNSPRFRENFSPQPPRGPRTPPNTPPADIALDNDPLHSMSGNANKMCGWNMNDMQQTATSNKILSNYGLQESEPPIHHSAPYRQAPPVMQSIPYNDVDYCNYSLQRRPPLSHSSHNLPAVHHGQHPQHRGAFQPNLPILQTSPNIHHSSAAQQHSYHPNQPPHQHLQLLSAPFTHSQSNAIDAPILGSGDGFYYQTNFGPNSSESQPPPKFYNLIEVVRQEAEPRQETLVVQKGNVLEIMPAEMQTEQKSESNNDQNDAQRQIALQQQMRLKRKLGRQQKRAEREKRKEFLVAEIKRLNDQMLVGSNGKMIRASELFANPSWREEVLHANIASDSTTPAVIQNECAPVSSPSESAIHVTPTIYVYDPNACAGKSILSDTTDATKTANIKNSIKKAVKFSDGIVPGEGTSASENDDQCAESNVDKKKQKKKHLYRRKQAKRNKALSRLGSSSQSKLELTDKENYLIDEKIQTDIKTEVLATETYIPAAPPGLPPSNLPQPKLKNPEKYIVNQLIYFHYNIQDHSMYVSPCPHPTHLAPVNPPPITTALQVSGQYPRNQRCANESPVNSEQLFTKKGVLFSSNHHNKKMQDTPSDYVQHASLPMETLPKPYPHSTVPYNMVLPNSQTPTQYSSSTPNSQMSTSFEDTNFRNTAACHPQAMFRMPPPTPLQQPYSIANQPQVNRFSANVPVPAYVPQQ